jgi:hypothetical protein
LGTGDLETACQSVETGLLPELAEVAWRPRASENSLHHTERLWLASTVAHVLPFVVVAVVFAVLKPLLVPISLLALAQAWIIPELYAARGAKVLRPPRARRDAPGDHPGAERTALGLLGDLVDHRTRALHQRTGLVVQRGELGAWVLGEAGAVLVRPGGRRVHCYCVKPTDATLPHADRVAHLLLALRADEPGFATVANVAFCGARWRLRRRLDRRASEALDAAF